MDHISTIISASREGNSMQVRTAFQQAMAGKIAERLSYERASYGDRIFNRGQESEKS